MNSCAYCGIGFGLLGLLRLFEKAGGGFHNTGLEPPALLLGVLLLKVMEVGHAEPAADGVDVEIDVLTPLFVKRTKKKRPDSASFGTTEPLQFPDVGQEVLELFR